ncbi:arabinosyltransferase, partial [Dietzia sp. SLG510A3-3B2-2]|nr:arabinosyltransferase [Dietzia sp. SLG510A3-3B2-2]
MDRHRRWAIITGFLGAFLAVLAGILPVDQDTTRVQWTAGPDYAPVTAPLVSGRPLDLTITAPCAPLAQVPENTIVFSTLPQDAPGRISDGLVVQRVRDAAGDPVIEVAVRNITLLSVPLSTLRDPACETLHVRAETGILTAEFTGLERDADDAVRAAVPGSMRPQVTGVFTDLTAATAPDGLGESTVEVTVDSRYSSSPTLLKLVLMVIGVLATLASVVFLHRLDGIDGRSGRRFVPRSWSRLSGVDGVVIGVLGFWHLVGANTSDDGYLLTMARSAGPSGYMANYYRWLGSPESPVGWYYEILRVFAEVSTASPWMRLPTLVCGILSWLIISREVVPRLGRLARTWRGPRWTGAALFLAFWMAFNNGLRPEPVIALGALLTWVSVERAIATRRMLPFAIAVIIASFSLATGPTGLMAVAALIMGLRAVVRTVVVRGRRIGSYLALIAPVLASGTMVLIVVFGVQNLAAVLEAIRVRGEIGPNLNWFEEFVRYYYLMIPTVDGSLARRLPVLLVLLCLALVIGTMLRRGKVPGAASGPVWRLVGVVVGTAFFMMFSPTKWTHHFGVYAGIGGAIAALGALAISASAVRTARNRTLFLGVILVVVALAFAGPNGWWYVSSYGIPWWDKAPSVRGIDAATVLLALAVLTFAYAGWQHLRRDYIGEHAPRTSAGRRRVRTFAAAPIAVVAGLLVVFSFASFAKGIHKQYPAYTIAAGNVSALAGNPCMLADRVLVEPDANAGMLDPLDATPLPDGSIDPRDRAAAIEAGENTAFTPDGVAPDLSA